MPVALVGSENARSVHGWSAGADLACCGRSCGPDLGASLRAVRIDGEDASAGSLAELAAVAAAECDRALVVVAGDLNLELPALLDLLDRPGDATAALVIDPRDLEAPSQVYAGLEHAALLRVGGDGRVIESAGTSRHLVSIPNRVSVGLLRIAGRDRARAAELWALAAAEVDGLDLFDAALMVLVRGGLAIGAQPLGYYSWSRGPVSQSGVPGSAWQQRLRTASRSGDGLYSTYLVRPLSRRFTELALRADATPNLVTMISLLIGIGTAVLVWTGQPWAWIIAAFALQLALVVDCMDGEIARFRRTFSTLGAWLDGVGDRVKEYAVLAALAVVAVRDGHTGGWLLALVAMGLVTARHLEDQSYNDRLAPGRRSRPQLLPIAATDDGGRPGSRSDLAAPADRSRRVIFWAKKLIHVPIAERYLILSVGLLTLQPVWTLVASIVASALAVAWTVGGRLLLAVRAMLAGRQGPEPAISGLLDQQLDLGPIARLGGRLGRLPFALGFPVTLLLWAAAAAAVVVDRGLIAAGLALIAAATAGMACRPPLAHPLAWLALPFAWVAEVAVGSALLAHGQVGGYVFVFLAVVAYRRYDLIYSLRLTGKPPSRWISVLDLGVEGRILLVGVIAALAAAVGMNSIQFVQRGLLVASGYLLVVCAAESIRQWAVGSGPGQGKVTKGTVSG